MAFQIYQAWLQGPHALFRLFEETFGRRTIYGPPDPDEQERTIDALSDHIGRLKAQIERLQAEASDLRGRNFQLQRRNAELEAIVVKDSHNFSRPPSSDPPWAKRTRSLRRPSGSGRVGRSDTMGRRSGSVNAPTVRSSTGRKSAGAVTRRSTRRSGS
jgi:uncharacterized coiled-coil protein SlyX